MMKKLSKIALLAAATAFLLGGVTACFTSTSDVDEDSGILGSGSTGNDGESVGGGTTYKLLPSDISSWTTAKENLTDITTDGAKFQAGAGVTYDTASLGEASIKLNGRAQKTGKNCIVLTTTSDNVVVTVKFAVNSANNLDRYVVAIEGTSADAVDSSNAPVASAIKDDTNKPSASKTITTASLTLPTAGTYSIGGTNGIFITEISLTM